MMMGERWVAHKATSLQTGGRYENPRKGLGMTRRSRAREVVLQLLFQRDINPTVPRPIIEAFLRERLRDPELEGFSRTLFDQVVTRIGEVDQKLTRAADNWRLSRMTCVDRNVLRLGAYEVLFPTESTPAPVAIDEAIELARRYGSKDSPSFVNGVLDKILQMRSSTDAPSIAS
jgi:transcription antitermination protein NusB